MSEEIFQEEEILTQHDVENNQLKEEKENENENEKLTKENEKLKKRK